MEAPITKRQEEFLRAEDRRINILSGSVRSGKTYISLIKWALFVGRMPKSYEFIMCGKTVTALKRNCLNLLEELVGSKNFKYSISQKSGVLFGRRVWLEGANDERSESKIRGMTLGGAYCDELTLFPETFYNMLLSRLSLTGARLYATTNPDAPTHWVKQDILDNEEIDIVSWKFLLTDNTFLDPKYVDNIKREFTGVFYDRLILGEWVRAEGAIYGMFDTATMVVNKLPEMTAYWIGVDYGHSNATVFLLLGAGVDHKLYVCSEYYHSGTETRESVSPRFYADALVKWVKKALGNDSSKLNNIFLDPSAKGFKLQLRESGVTNVRSADNSVLEGIGLVGSALSAGILRFHASCKRTIEEMSAYAWDEKAQARGEDKPIKTADHCCDSLRYCCMGIKQYIKRAVANVFESEKK